MVIARVARSVGEPVDGATESAELIFQRRAARVIRGKMRVWTEQKLDPPAQIVIDFPGHPLGGGNVPHRLVASPGFEQGPLRGGLLGVSCEHVSHLLGSRTYEP